MSDDVTALVAGIPDPELPMVTIADLGILRDVRVEGDRVTVTITPTYSGCPALAEIGQGIRSRLDGAGYRFVQVRTALAPAWTTGWITDEGRRKLAVAGVAPPGPAPRRNGPTPLRLQPISRAVQCPQCGSGDTVEQAAHGSTACTAQYVCRSCAEPFPYLKEL